jgi:hypothetical protein
MSAFVRTVLALERDAITRWSRPLKLFSMMAIAAPALDARG